MRIYDMLPDLSDVKQLGASNYKVALLGSKPIIVVFWSVSCSSCGYFLQQLAEVPEIKSKEVVPILIHTYLTKEYPNAAEIRYKLDQIRMDAICLDDVDDQLTNKFQFRFVPAFYLFDKYERLRFMQIGKSSTSLIEKRLKRLLHTN
ncbi:thioredoxin fold domain-containing protein [Oceanobacillus sp. J11TS1]|uniref:TlpA family protein disulfide reductase n=1 Tax=Oceanobacillus sp. J11TS1 TaxID=2807191 RepID=UPI001B11BB21|nr:thioredoxin fold domain-containing protein [Oceanobacillus sp. J11TS1]GIO22363.1 thiol-disulfide oxidoreductase YkuV [Oceanobacillus sp. J11TS1]